jgi:Bacterial HORMA domain 2
MASSVTVYTYTHSVTYVTQKMLSSIKQIILDIGLDPAKFASDFNTYDVGVRTWLESSSEFFGFIGYKMRLYN